MPKINTETKTKPAKVIEFKPQYNMYIIQAKYRIEGSPWTAWAQTTEDPAVNSLYHLDDDMPEFKNRPTDARRRAFWHAYNGESLKHGYDTQIILKEPNGRQTLIYNTDIGECNIVLISAKK